jgi:putative aldouronate transport system substrate-binding protein
MRIAAKGTMLLLVLVLFLIPSLVFAGGAKDTSGAGTEGTEGASREEATVAAAQTAGGVADTSLRVEDFTNLHVLPLMKDKVTITMAGRVGDSTFGRMYDFWNIREIEKRTNIHIDYQVVVGNPQYSENIIARIAAGDVPDLFAVRGNIMEYIDGGILAKLNPLIPEYQPNIEAFYARRPDLAALTTMPDGNMYSVRVPIPDNIYIIPLIRADWLEKLGLERPETLEDWENFLRAIRDNDMNGNGDPNDEKGMVAWESMAPSNYFAQAWGLGTWYSGGWTADDDGKVYYSYTSPRYKEVLAWFNKLYNERLVDQALYSDPSTARPAANQWGDNVRGLGAATMNWNFAPGPNGAWSSLLAEIPGAYYTWCKPPVGPYGDRMNTTYGPIAGDHWAISADSDQMEATAKMMDFVWASKEGHLLTWWGVEGGSYKLVDGGPQWMPGYREGELESVTAPDGEVIPIKPENLIRAWVADGIGIQTENWYEENNFKREPLTVEATNNTIDYLTPKFPMVPLTPGESQILSDNPGIGDYVREMTIKFISGMEPLDNFDVFVQQLERLGVAEHTKVRQAQYDRYQAVMK